MIAFQYQFCTVPSSDGFFLFFEKAKAPNPQNLQFRLAWFTRIAIHRVASPGVFLGLKKKTPSELPPEKQNKKRQSSGSSRNKKNKPSGQNSKNSASRGQKIHSSSQRSKKRRNLSSTNQPHREPSGHSAQGMPTRPPEHCAGCPPGH